MGRDTAMVGGETFSIKEIKTYYSEQIARIMIDETNRLITMLPPDAYVELYIVTGGGAYTFGEYIKKALVTNKMVAKPEDVIQPEDPVIANAEGFELVAMSRAEEADE